MGAQFYYLKDIKIVGKVEDFVPYLFNKRIGWHVDNDNLLMDRLAGYDGESIGATSMMDQIEEITKERAEKYIANL